MVTRFSLSCPTLSCPTVTSSDAWSNVAPSKQVFVTFVCCFVTFVSGLVTFV